MAVVSSFLAIIFVLFNFVCFTFFFVKSAQNPFSWAQGGYLTASRLVVLASFVLLLICTSTVLVRILCKRVSPRAAELGRDFAPYPRESELAPYRYEPPPSWYQERRSRRRSSAAVFVASPRLSPRRLSEQHQQERQRQPQRLDSDGTPRIEPVAAQRKPSSASLLLRDGNSAVVVQPVSMPVTEFVSPAQKQASQDDGGDGRTAEAVGDGGTLRRLSVRDVSLTQRDVGSNEEETSPLTPSSARAAAAGLSRPEEIIKGFDSDLPSLGLN